MGLGLFGFIGLIFGPLLISYIILLFKIYSNEFTDKHVEQSVVEDIPTDEKKEEKAAEQ